MTNRELVCRLKAVADALVPAAGELMRRACGDLGVHAEGCGCQTCRAFVAVHDAQNEIESIISAVSASPVT